MSCFPEGKYHNHNVIAQHRFPGGKPLFKLKKREKKDSSKVVGARPVDLGSDVGSWLSSSFTKAAPTRSQMWEQERSAKLQIAEAEATAATAQERVRLRFNHPYA